MKLPIVIAFLLFGAVFAGSAAAQTNSDPVIQGSASYSMPQSAIDAEIAGTVVMGIRVDETGTPTKAVLMSGPMWPCSTTPGKELEDLSATLSDTMLKLRFSPAMADGRPVTADIGLTLQLKNPKLVPMPAEIDPATGKPIPKMISGGVLNGKAKSLPVPPYPPEARANRDSGSVVIQILIGEDGKVLRAGAISGAATLQFAAREAACKAQFSPTTLQGRPVKVSGVITYNFNL
jgi:TonB family protein